MWILPSFSTHHCFFATTEKCRKYLDKNGASRELLRDLSKAFDCLLHDLLIAKLAAYGFDYEFSTLIQSYLSNRKQRTKVNNTYVSNTFSDIIIRVSQGSILGPLLFNIYDNTDCDIANYADDNMPYCSSFSLDKVINKLGACTDNVFNGFIKIKWKPILTNGTC